MAFETVATDRPRIADSFLIFIFSMKAFYIQIPHNYLRENKGFFENGFVNKELPKWISLEKRPEFSSGIEGQLIQVRIPHGKNDI